MARLCDMSLAKHKPEESTERAVAFQSKLHFQHDCETVRKQLICQFKFNLGK